MHKRQKLYDKKYAMSKKIFMDARRQSDKRTNRETHTHMSCANSVPSQKVIYALVHNRNFMG